MAAAPPVIDIAPVTDFAALAPLWRDLEQRAACSFFQSWAWTGCLAGERFAEPWLLTARRGDTIVGLALFNRGPRAGLSRPILLGESGRADLDSIFIEHNGLALDRNEAGDLAALCWSAVAERFGNAKWVISGTAEAAAFPAGRIARIRARRPAPYLDLSPDADPFDGFSANTRQQLRRSLRAWEEIGPLTFGIATSDQADGYLDALAELHQAYWTGRGKPGAFAEPFFGRFHHALLTRASDRQSVDLIRVSAGDRVAGYLYNFVHDGWVAAYQSGFDFGPDADSLRPGLVCHLMAIRHYAQAGMRRYDFLGGEARYKRSLANAEIPLVWLDVRHKLPWQSRRQGVSSR
ncbi:MAG TPA: GNAT family N-acetyltransferase [Alphaproteobacteria bacterium]|jgi:CelD/BcsL family acetyltransferase involved in cellulose biosynthesis|nr:GNAT family N-acetyltransferase [Alphaproteobacteria bacterium]